jgi:hypothetical protein
MIWFNIFSGCSNSEITALTLDRKSIAILSKIFIWCWMEFQMQLQLNTTCCRLMAARFARPACLFLFEAKLLLPVPLN